MYKLGMLLLATCLVATASAGRLSRIVKRATGLPKYNPDLYTTTKSPNSPHWSQNSEPYVNPNAPYQGNPFYPYQLDNSPWKSDKVVYWNMNTSYNRELISPKQKEIDDYWKIDPNAPTSKPFKQEDLYDKDGKPNWDLINERYSSNRYFNPGGYESMYSTTQSSSSKKGYTGDDGYVNNNQYINHFSRAYGAEMTYYNQMNRGTAGYVSDVPNNGFKPGQKPSDKGTPPGHKVYDAESYQKLHQSGYVGNVPNNGYKPGEKPNDGKPDYFDLYSQYPAYPYYGSALYNQGGYVGNQDYKPYGNSDSRPYPSWDYQNQKNYQQGYKPNN